MAEQIGAASTNGSTPMNGELGRLTAVPVREQWPDEAQDFTPWLAQEENLRLLSDAIEMDLETYRTEEPIGPFRADIVAKEGDGIVIIENQLGPTDHKHLGQLMVYATNRSARAVVWVATRVTDEYRKVLDWLNANTPEDIAFFGLEIELWRIGESLCAPKFNVVCKPNELTKIEAASRPTEPTETKLLQLEFWSAVKSKAEESGSPLKWRKPRPQHWYSLAIGRSGFRLNLTSKTTANKIGCEIYMSGASMDANLAFEQLEQGREAIEAQVGELDWQPLPHAGACRIVQKRPADLVDTASWQALVDWCIERAETFHSVFAPLIQRLDLETVEDDGTVVADVD